MKIISGKYARRKLIAPSPNSNIRPTYIRTKELTFNILQHQTKCFGKNQQPAYLNGIVLDLFAGTGSLGLECLSREAEKVIFIDKSIESLKIIQKNLEILGATNYECYKYNALFLPQAIIACDLVFIDPPYYHGLAEKVLLCLQKKNWLKSTTIIFLKLPKKENFDLPPIFQIICQKLCGSACLLFIKLI